MSIISVDCKNLQDNPKCAHGPTLKFTRLIKGKEQCFYACSACRDRKDCPFFLLEGEKITASKQLSWEEWKRNIFPQIDHSQSFSKLISLQKLEPKLRCFCHTCSCLIFSSEVDNHSKHNIKHDVSDTELKQPSLLLWPIQNRKKEAQFWFTQKTQQFIFSNLNKMNIRSVINVGTPTIHEILRGEKTNSILLDIDHRYHSFYSPKEYLWFNMLNFYFMCDEGSVKKTFRKSLNKPPVAVLMDPPFGARVELLSQSIENFHKESSEKLIIILILPYFMEPQILTYMPQFRMLDFHVDYINHKKFKNKTDSSKLSPIRIFTNIEPHKFVFPEEDGYKFCEKCQAWRSKLNKHCDMCETCPSKNGLSYKHCNICKTCVKNTWSHCNTCQKCVLMTHVCYQKSDANNFKNKKRKIKNKRNKL